MSQPKPFTGRARRRNTAWSVRIGDVLARGLITVGGIGTIAAVSMVGLFLLWEVAPLFAPATVERAATQPAVWGTEPPLHFEIDENRTIGWAMSRDGTLRVFEAANGRLIEEQKPFEEAELTAARFTFNREPHAFGFADGTVRIGTIGFATRFLEAENVPAEIQKLPTGGTARFENGIIQRTPQGQFRLLVLETAIGSPLEVAVSPIRRLDYVAASTGPVLATWSEKERLRLHPLAEKSSPFGGDATLAVDESYDLPLTDAPAGVPDWLHLTGRGEGVYATWKSGDLLRFDARNVERLALAERIDLVADDSSSLTALELLLGRATFIAGDSAGRVVNWFLTRPDTPSDDRPKSTDRAYLTRIHQLGRADSPVTSLASSARTRMVAAGHEDGTVRVYHVTTDQLVSETRTETAEPVPVVFIAPNDDGLFAATAGGLWQAAFDPGHPEVTLRSLFRPVWYEGYAEPMHSWQSTGSTVDVEPKLGLMPLVFGTLKATVYSMLFGVPIALLAAIYTSEFLNPRLRMTIKPTVEIMASLPSVVLGFLAALVFAIWVERYLATVLASFLVVPYTVVLGAYLWQMLPATLTLRLARWRFFVILLAGIPAGIVLSFLLGPLFENWLFAGDLQAWLSATRDSEAYGSGTGGWFLLLLPVSAIAAAVLSGRYVTPWLIQRLGRASRGRFTGFELLKFLGLTVLTLGIAYLASSLLTLIGFDPRGSLLDTYVQRNALIVGFVMGFAVIPIIYTIADDALNSVPEQLRSASLGAGATPWQTTVRIVIPTAMSGLFSAIMVGLGRAVGETMIVLMAAGNTPVMNWNPFEGFRTLSANIAVELPEAVQGSTHYRSLFLAALTLFILTFTVNTVAEMIRLRFRRRVYQL